jgi:hypothetical protein
MFAMEKHLKWPYFLPLIYVVIVFWVASVFLRGPSTVPLLCFFIGMVQFLGWATVRFELSRRSK